MFSGSQKVLEWPVASQFAREKSTLIPAYGEGGLNTASPTPCISE